MSLRLLKEALVAADFKPHSLGLGSDLGRLGEQLSPMARTVFHLSWSEGTQVTLGELLSADPWPDDALRFYRTLGDEERMEVLGLAGFEVHELLHKIDVLTTPFGVGFHGRACLEAIGMQLDGSAFLEVLRRSEDNIPLRDHPRISELSTARRGPEALQARVLWFDALRGARGRFVEAGWGGDTTPLVLFGRRLTKVTVHEQVATVELPGARGRYLRPPTILESRAVAVTALNLFARLGADDYAATEVARYLRTFYAPGEVDPDYRFLIDLYAQRWGEDDFAAATESHGPAWLRQALIVIVVVGWYALQAPPLQDVDDSLANSSPVIRLVLALRAIEDAAADGRTWDTGVELLESIDAGERGRSLRLRPVRQNLEHCVRYARQVRDTNRRANSHPQLLAHFDHIFSVLEQQLAKRVDWGYNSALGMPDRGDLARGFQDPEVDEHLLIDSYQPPAEVRRWFELREELLFRYVRPPGFWEQLGAFLPASSLLVPCDCGRLTQASVPVQAARWTVVCDCGRSHEIDLDTDVERIDLDE